jgi:hypothetical protein
MAMKQTRLLTLTLACFFLVFSGCKKEEVKEDVRQTKLEWIAGTWKQKDITLAASARVSGIQLTNGMSLVTDPTLNAVFTSLFGGNPYRATVNNTYTFTADGKYSMEGAMLEYVFPKSKEGGTWKLEVHDTVISLFPSAAVRDPHWVSKVRPNELHLVLSVNFPGLGDVPLNLLLEK